MALLALTEVLRRFLVDGAELADGDPHLLDLALDGGEVGGLFTGCGGFDSAAGSGGEALAGHLGPQGLEALAGALKVRFQVEVAAAGLEEGLLRLTVLGLDGAFVGLQPGELVAVGSAVVGGALPLKAELFELPGLALDGLGEVAGFELQVLGAEDALGDLRGETLDGALLLLARENVGLRLALCRGEPSAGPGDLVDGLLDAAGGGIEVGGEGFQLGAELPAAGGELVEQDAGVLGGLLVKGAAGQLAAADENGGHIAAEAVETVAFALAGVEGVVEGAAALLVGAIALLDEAGEALDGLARRLDLLAVGLDDLFEVGDLGGNLVDLALAGEAEGALGGRSEAAGDDAGGVEEDAIERDNSAETAGEHAPRDLQVLDDDDASEEGIDEIAVAAVAADEPGGDADDTALLLEVERVALAEAVEGEELGAPTGAFAEELDGVEGL